MKGVYYITVYYGTYCINRNSIPKQIWLDHQMFNIFKYLM